MRTICNVRVRLSFFALTATVTLLLGAGPACASVSGSDPGLLQEIWKYASYGNSIGSTGIEIVDVDGDGDQEIVTAGAVGVWEGWANRIVYVLESTGTDTYERPWISDVYPEHIIALAVANLDGDSAGEIILLLNDGNVEIIDGGSKTLEVSFSTGITSANGMVVADADGDGNLEMVIYHSFSYINVFSLSAPYVSEWSSSSYAVSDVAVGNVDADPAPEIVITSSSSPMYVIDGVTHAVDWEYVDGDGYDVELGDVDGDGMEEIVASRPFNNVTIYDADIFAAKVESPHAHQVAALELYDTDGDNLPEIIIGEGQHGDILVYDAATFALEWSRDNPNYSVTNIALGDADNDGALEVAWGAGAGSSGPDNFYIANFDNATIWESEHLGGSRTVVDTGDVDDDGKSEIILLSSDFTHIFDGVTKEVEWQEALDYTVYGSYRSVKIGDPDGDNENEWVVARDKWDIGVVQKYNGATGILENNSAHYDPGFGSLAMGDVDGDGMQEVVAGIGYSGGNPYLVVLSGDLGTEEWKSSELRPARGGVFDIELADCDGDGVLEIIASVSGYQVYVFDGATHELQWQHPFWPYAVEVADVDDDGQQEILVGQQDGLVEVYHGATFELEDSFTLGTGAIKALEVADLDLDGRQEWLLSDSDSLAIFDGTTKELRWRHSRLGEGVGDGNNISVEDLDGDGRNDIVFGSGHALFHFEVTTSPRLAELHNDVIFDFGPGAGLWANYNDDPGAWRFLNLNGSEQVITADLDNAFGDEIIIDFGSGIGLWANYNDDPADWRRIHPLSPELMIEADLDNAGGREVVVDFGSGTGLWVNYNGDPAHWTRIHTYSPERMAAGDVDGSGMDDLVLDFGSGTGIWVNFDGDPGSWAWVHSFVSEDIAVGDLDGSGRDDIVIDFGSGVGVWVNHDGDPGDWARVHPFSPQVMGVGDFDAGGQDDLVLDFGSGVGIWINYNGDPGDWKLLHSMMCEELMVGDMDGNGRNDIVIDFGSSAGLWVNYNGDPTQWGWIHDESPGTMASGSVDGK